MGEVNEAGNTQISKEPRAKVEQQNENMLKFLDSADEYLILVETCSSALRQGWLEMASARHSMGASRVNSALLNLQHHSASTTVEVNYHDAGSMKNSPHFTLCKWASSDNKDSSLEKQSFGEDEQSKTNYCSPKLGQSENQESSWESNGSETNTLPPLSDGSETSASPRKNETPFLTERAKVLSMFGTLVSPKLRASQLSFETALEALVEIANTRLAIIEAHDRVKEEIKNAKE